MVTAQRFITVVYSAERQNDEIKMTADGLNGTNDDPPSRAAIKPL